MPTKKASAGLTQIGKRQHKNPVCLALEWKLALDEGKHSSCAALARALGVSRARVTQILNLLDLSTAVKARVQEMGDPLPGRHLCERKLRSLLELPKEDQTAQLEAIFD